MPTQYQAGLRHARYFLQRMIVFNDIYERGNERAYDAVQEFYTERENICKGQGWAVALMDVSEEGSRFAVEYAAYGTYVKDLVLSAQEQIDWLSVGLKAAIATENKQDQAILLGNLGSAYHSLGDLEQAEKYYKEYLNISRRINYPSGEINALCNLGIIHKDLGNIENAISYYLKSLEKYEQENASPRTYCSILGNLGSAYLWLGEFPKAKKYLKQAMNIARQSGDVKAQAQLLSNMASVDLEQCDYEEAITGYSQAILIHRRLGNLSGEGIATGNLGLAYARQQQYGQAISYYEKALEIQLQIGNRRGLGPLLNNLGAVYAALGESQHAIDLYSERLNLALEFHDPRGALAALENLGLIYADLDEIDLSVGFYKQALDLAGQMKIQSSVLEIHKRMQDLQK